MEFPPPDLTAWQKQLERDLRDRNADSIAWRTADDFVLPALSTRADLGDLPHLQALPLLQARAGWQVRELVTESAPPAAALRARQALARGADEIEFCLDSLAHDAREPEPETEPAAEDDEDLLAGWTAPGDGGVSIHSRADFDAALDGVDVAAASVWFSAGEGALAVLAWHLRRAAELGVDPATLRGGVDVDPIARLTMRQVAMPDDYTLLSRRADERSVFEETAAIVTGCARHCPDFRPLVIDGQQYHLAGASHGFELGATLAAVVDTARRLQPFGVDFDTLARAATLRVQVGHELLLEIAKLRALRLLWARIAHAFGARPEALVPRVLAVTSGRQRADEFDQRTNLLRTTIASFAAVTGGCDSLIVLSYDDAVDDATEVDLARSQQLLLRDEAHLARVADPVAGSYAIERLTDALGRRAFAVLQEIEAEGGLIATMRSGWLADRILGQEQAREKAFRVRRKVLVGVTRFADLELGGPAPRPEPEPEALGQERVRRHLQRMRNRDHAAVHDFLATLRDSGPDLVAHAVSDRADHATLAEISTARWPAPGVDFEHRFLPLAAGDAHEFEDLRLWAELRRDSGEPVPEVLLLPLGPVGMARARADFARDLFLVGGFEVRDAGLLASADAALATLDARQPGIAVLCSDDASYPALVDALAEPCRDRGVQLVIAGRVDANLAARVDGSIHLGMDVVAFLDELQSSLTVDE
ncbi:MAG: hypothetical protein IPM29_08130 [Planctomycetes bacterium]|nr:hypothetical protein [Planctomycetota bacterium]